MKRHQTIAFFKNGIATLAFLFISLFAFSHTFSNEKFDLRESDSEESTIHSPEFFYASANHLNETPESQEEIPFSGTSEKSTEKESEDDSNDDDKFTIHELDFISIAELKLFVYTNSVFSVNEHFSIPKYILFHSWKSFLF